MQGLLFFVLSFIQHSKYFIYFTNRLEKNTSAVQEGSASLYNMGPFEGRTEIPSILQHRDDPTSLREALDTVYNPVECTGVGQNNWNTTIFSTLSLKFGYIQNIDPCVVILVYNPCEQVVLAAQLCVFHYISDLVVIFL